MKSALTPILSLLLAGTAAAQVTYVPYSAVRGQALGRDNSAPAVGFAVPVKYRMEGPAVEKRTTAPNLTAAHVQRLFEGLAAVEGSSGRVFTLEPKHAQAIKTIFDKLDAQMPEPITAQRWDEIIDVMLKTCRENFAKSGFNWDKTMTQALDEGVMKAQMPPNITEEQANDLMARVIGIMEKVDRKESLSDQQVARLMQGLMMIDSKFVDPISTERWDAILKDMGDLAEKEYAGKGRNWDTVIDHMLQSAMTALKEPHSVYMDPAQAKMLSDSMSGTLIGIGVGVSSDTKGMKLDTIYPGSGAEKAGLREGDVIVWVRDVGQGKVGRSLAGLKLDDAVKLVRGEEGTIVEVKVLRGSETVGPIPVTRSKVELPNVFSKMAAPGIGYVYLLQFSQKSDERVLGAVRELRGKGAKSVILDVRGNPGGIVQMVASIVSEFFKDGDLIVAFKHQGKTAFQAVTEGNGEFVDVPVVVLVDDGSASASEILSGAIQDKRPGYAVIGSRSYGKGTEQVILPQLDGRALKITENRWYTPNDRNIAAQADPKTGLEMPGTGGVVPNLTVEVSEDQRGKIMKSIMQDLFGRKQEGERPRDPVLEKAIEVLSGANAG
ncbi:MAG: S41 family peptidase [Elusimicrobiota bacterium]|jgi:carboxyl-terminal processing protease